MHSCDTDQPDPTQSPTPAPDSCGCTCNSIVIDADYTTTANDYYIGVNATSTVTITLVDAPSDCTKVVIKSEMTQPVGNKKITINGSGSALIDGKPQYVIQNVFKSVQLFARSGNWHTIG